MSFPDPPPPPNPFTSPPFPGGYWAPFMMENEQPDLVSQFDGSPFKRPRNSEQPPNFGPFPPMNPRVNPPNIPGGRGTGHMFYKTRICAKFTEGTCRNGETCSFAHGPEDLREPPPNWQELIREKDRGGFGRQGGDPRMRHHGMKICKKYYNGEECPYGDKCNFLHERRVPFPPRFKADVPSQRESAVISIGTTGFDQTKQASGNSDSYQSKTVLWKTKICSKWEIGQCPFGERCHYAHGVSDLKLSDTGVEAEQATKSGSVPANPLSSSVQSMAPAKLAIGAVKEDGFDKKAWKLRLSRKINGIYGDWLDDGTSPRGSPSKDEI